MWEKRVQNENEWMLREREEEMENVPQDVRAAKYETGLRDRDEDRDDVDPDPLVSLSSFIIIIVRLLSDLLVTNMIQIKRCY